MAEIRFRVRGPGWVETVTATSDWTIQKLLDHLKDKQNAEPAALKYGWPLKTIELSDPSASIEPLNLKGEAITFVPKEEATPAPEPSAATKQPEFKPKPVEADSTVIEWLEKDGYLGESFSTRRQVAIFEATADLLPQHYVLCLMTTRVCSLLLEASCNGQTRHLHCAERLPSTSSHTQPNSTKSCWRWIPSGMRVPSKTLNGGVAQ